MRAHTSSGALLRANCPQAGQRLVVVSASRARAARWAIIENNWICLFVGAAL